MDFQRTEDRTVPAHGRGHVRHHSFQDDDDFDLWSIAATLLRGKWWIAASVAIVVAIGAFYVFRVATPKYSATAMVALQSRQEQVVDLENVVSGLRGDASTINTEVEVLRSRNLAARVVTEANLVADPEFNPSLRPKERFTIGALIEGAKGIIGIKTPPKPPRSESAQHTTSVALLRQATSISTVRNSFVFQITVVTNSPEKSAVLANTLAEQYVLDQVEVKLRATQQATAWLSDRVAELKSELETAEAKVKTFDASSKLVSPEALIVLNRQLKDMRERAEGAHADADAAIAHAENLRLAAKQGDAAKVMDIAADRILRSIHDTLGADDPAFARRIAEMIDAAELEGSRRESQALALDQSVDDIQTQISSQSEDLVELQQLTREATASGLIYEYFLGRLKETAVQQGIQQADSRILSSAVAPGGPSEPRVMMTLLACAILGLFGGASGVVLRELAQNTFRTPEDLERATGHTVMGQIPLGPIESRDMVLDYLVSRPNSAMAEAVRNLRTSIMLSNIDQPPVTIMITSSVPGEGKTTKAVSLAQNFAAIGKKTLLVEADIRRCVMKEYFKDLPEGGLIDALLGEKPLDQLVHHVTDLGFDILQGQRTSTNAADIFASEKFSDLLKSLAEVYEVVLVDTPPILAVPDARVIGVHMDAVLYVVRWDRATKTQVSQGLRAFETVGTRVTGLVFNQIDRKGMKSYGYSDRYGTYSHYYQD